MCPNKRVCTAPNSDVSSQAALPVKSRHWLEKLHPSILNKIIELFLSIPEANALNRANQALRKTISLDEGRHAWLKTPCCLLYALFVRKVLQCSEKEPMTNSQFHLITKIETLGIKVNYSWIHHFRLDSTEYIKLLFIRPLPPRAWEWHSTLHICNIRIKKFVSPPKTRLDLNTYTVSMEKQFEDRGFGQFRELTALKSLELEIDDDHRLHSPVDSDFLHLTCLTELESLKISQRFSDNGLSILQSLSKLKTLILQDCMEITQTGIAHIARYPALQALSFVDFKNNIHAPTFNFRDLRPLTGLHSLSFRECKWLTKDQLEQLQHLPALQNLDLHATTVDRDKLAVLAHCRSLERLNISRILITDFDAKDEIEELIDRKISIYDVDINDSLDFSFFHQKHQPIPIGERRCALFYLRSLKF